MIQKNCLPTYLLPSNLAEENNNIRPYNFNWQQISDLKKVEHRTRISTVACDDFFHFSVKNIEKKMAFSVFLLLIKLIYSYELHNRFARNKN